MIGSPTFTLGFKLAGARKTFEVETPQALNQAVRASMQDETVGIVLLETNDLPRLDASVRRDLETSVRPTLVTIGLGEDTGLREKLKQALGVDLWK